MKIRKFVWIIAYLIIVFVGYLFLFKPSTVVAKNIFIEKVLTQFIESKSKLLLPEKQLGMYRPELPFSLRGVHTTQKQINTKMSLVSFYQTWGGYSDSEFKLEVMKNIYNAGYTPVVTWEPWTTKFSKKDTIWENSCQRIYSGKYDSYIRIFAQEAVKFGKPFFIRPFHEFSNYAYQWSSHYGNSIEDIKKAWIHVYNIFQDVGATNASFVWTPYSIADMAYYPGDDYVDWIGLDLFNFGTFNQENRWYSFQEIYKPWKEVLAENTKPVLITEMGSVKIGGDHAKWYEEAFEYWVDENKIKAIILFDHPAHRLNENEQVDLGINFGKDLIKISTDELMHQKLKLSEYKDYER